MENVSALAAGQTAPVTHRLLAGAAAGAMTLGAAFVWYFDPSREGILPACPLYQMTGFACSGCGTTRGFHALFHGDILAALDYNALIPVFILVLGFFYLSMLKVAIRGRGFPAWMVSLPALYGFLALLIVFGIVRNIPVYPFTWLFP